MIFFEHRGTRHISTKNKFMIIIIQQVHQIGLSFFFRKIKRIYYYFIRKFAFEPYFKRLIYKTFFLDGQKNCNTTGICKLKQIVPLCMTVGRWLSTAPTQHHHRTNGPRGLLNPWELRISKRSAEEGDRRKSRKSIFLILNINFLTARARLKEEEKEKTQKLN